MAGSALLIIRGIVSVTIGVLAIGWPGITIAVLVAIFAAYAILDGITNLVIGFTRTPTHGISWAQIVGGIVGIAAGGLAFYWPSITAIVLVLFIASWAIITGVFEIVAAVRLRKMIQGEWLLALSGILSILFGGLVFAFPGAGAVGIAWVLGIYAVAAGFVLIVLGMRLRSMIATRI